MFIAILVGLLGFVTAVPTPVPTPVPTTETCSSVMEAAGISEDVFASMVTHAIHSLSLEDIRYYFKANATEQNNIPVVNNDLRIDQDRLLAHAPIAGYDDDFSTPGMRHFDRAMRNLGREEWSIKNYGILEEITHVLHMAELWNAASKQYKLLEKTLDPQSDLCACVTDIENNGVMKYLNLGAMKIRYPGITSGNETLTAPYVTTNTSTRQKRASPWQASYSHGGYSASYDTGKFSNFRDSAVFRSALMDFDFNRKDIQILQEVVEKLADYDIIMASAIDSPEHWDYWKKITKTAMLEELYYNTAVFMFCRLNMN